MSRTLPPGVGHRPSSGGSPLPGSSWSCGARIPASECRALRAPSLFPRRPRVRLSRCCLRGPSAAGVPFWGAAGPSAPPGPLRGFPSPGGFVSAAALLRGVRPSALQRAGLGDCRDLGPRAAPALASPPARRPWRRPEPPRDPRPRFQKHRSVPTLARNGGSRHGLAWDCRPGRWGARCAEPRCPAL